MSKGYSSDACKERIYRKGKRSEAKERAEQDPEYEADESGSSEEDDSQDDENAALTNDEMDDFLEVDAVKRGKQIKKGQIEHDQITEEIGDSDGFKRARGKSNRKRKSQDSISPEAGPKRPRIGIGPFPGAEEEAETSAVGMDDIAKLIDTQHQQSTKDDSDLSNLSVHDSELSEPSVHDSELSEPSVHDSDRGGPSVHDSDEEK